MNVTPPRIAACLQMFCAAAIIIIGCGTSAQIIVPSPAPPDGGTGDRFRFLGIDGAGQVWILGDCRNDCEHDQVLFRFTGDGFDSTPLLPLPNAYYANARRISRDGQYIVGLTARDGNDEPTLWARKELLVPKSLGYFLADGRTDPWDVASTPTGPLVVGSYGFGTFLWREGTGYQAWMTNSAFWPLRWTFLVSADGTRWAGQQISLSGSNVIDLPFAGTETMLELLETKGGSNGRVFAISPNGQCFTGIIDGQTAIWRKKQVEFVSFEKNVAALQTVTDSGYSGGGSGAGNGVIYNSHGRKLELFDTWWAKNYPDVPLPAHVRHVSDLYEHGGNLYCLIDLEDSATYYRTSALAIAPLKHKSD